MLKIKIWIASVFSVVLTYSISSSADNQIQYLAHGDESLAARIEALESAKQSIDFTTYMFEPCDSSTKIMIDTLIAKAKAGIKVRLVLDAYPSGSPQRRADMTTFFAQHNIELRYYNKGILGPGYGRTHIKLLVIDGRLAEGKLLSGGRNATDAFYGLAKDTNYLDADFYIQGDVVANAQFQFDNLWSSFEVKKVKNPGNVGNLKTCFLKNKRDLEVADYFKKNTTKILDAIPVRTCPKTAFFMDDDKFRFGGHISTGKDDPKKDETDLTDAQLKYKHTTRNYIAFLNNATNSLFIVNQYYLPVERLRRTMKDLRNRKIKILVYTNRTGDAPGSKAEAMTQVMLDSAKDDSIGTQKVIPVSSLGALNDTHNLTPSSAQGQWRIHTKAAIRDNKDLFVGSYNMDDLSYRGNLEEGMIVRECPDLLGDVKSELVLMDEVHKNDMKNCVPCAKEVVKSFFDYIKGEFLSSFF